VNRIGLLGGTFDPPHVAHLVLAEVARRELSLDELWFVPARMPPHKPAARVSPPAVRLQLLRRALAGLDGFRIEPIELSRRGPSYTVDTLETLHARRPGVEWWLVLGADMLADLPRWRRPARVLELAGIAAAPRPGARMAWPRALPRARFQALDAPCLELSSSDLRARVARGASIRFLVPEGVERLVRARRLYARAPGPIRRRRVG
jgi:nicotinate-nucleotide adenylyltransferase